MYVVVILSQRQGSANFKKRSMHKVKKYVVCRATCSHVSLCPVRGF